MADRPARKTRTPHRAQVVRTDRLTPHMVRVVLGGDGLADFHAGECTDHYIKLLFPTGGAVYPEPFDLERIRAEFPREQWPVTRTYTVRAWDPAARELTVDFVTHGDEGLAGPWAARVRPGEEIHFMGPGGAYAPSAEADWHLLAGDESALPAIATALERLTDSRAGGAAEVPVHVFIEVADETEELKVTAPEGVQVNWLHRGAAPVGEALVAAVRGLEFPSGQIHAFVHGEAGFVKEIRRHLRLERQIPREWLSISGYWRRGHDEDGWQASKREWNQQVEAEQEGAGPEEAAA